jgi:hypothetical protein
MIISIRIAPSDRVFKLASRIIASAVNHVDAERALTIAQRVVSVLEEVERESANGRRVVALLVRRAQKIESLSGYR